MAYLLGYGSAVEWLRLNKNASLLSQRYALPMLSLEGSRRKLTQHAARTSDLTKPLHLIVSTREARRTTADAICHLFTTPNGLYPAVRIDRRLFVSGPELAFLQMANVLDDERLRFLGMELCGRYGIDRNGKAFSRVQTCTPETLYSTAAAMPHAKGRRRAMACAAHVWGGAASPMEAALTLILCGEPERGGFGLEPPELNHPLLVEGYARTIWIDDHITPDLLWERAKLVIEYDSDLYHTASDRIARDSVRRDVLTELGYRVITVTTEHMCSPNELERIARIVARHLGSELGPVIDEDWIAKASYQSRMRKLATHPEQLLGFTNQRLPRRRSWKPRPPDWRYSAS